MRKKGAGKDGLKKPWVPDKTATEEEPVSPDASDSGKTDKAVKDFSNLVRENGWEITDESGVLVAIVKSPEEYQTAKKEIGTIAKQAGYNSSFGVRLKCDDKAQKQTEMQDSGIVGYKDVKAGDDVNSGVEIAGDDGEYSQLSFLFDG